METSTKSTEAVSTSSTLPKLPSLSEEAAERISCHFNYAACHIHLCPSDGSITFSELRREIFPTETNRIQILNENPDNPLIKLLKLTEKEIKALKKSARDEGRSLYSKIVDLTPSSENHQISSTIRTLTTINALLDDISRSKPNFSGNLIQKLYHSFAVSSEIVNLLVKIEIEPSVILLDPAALTFINTATLRMLINRLDPELRTRMIDNLEEQGSFDNMLLSMALRGDEEALIKEMIQDTANVRKKILNLFDFAIKFGYVKIVKYIMNNFASYYLESIASGQHEEHYVNFISSTIQAFIRGNVEICLPLIQPIIWNLYRFEEQVSIIRLIALRSGDETREILIRNLYENNLFTLLLYIKSINLPTLSEEEMKKITEAFKPYHKIIFTEQMQSLLDHPHYGPEGYMQLSGLAHTSKYIKNSIKIDFIRDNYEAVALYIRKIDLAKVEFTNSLTVDSVNKLLSLFNDETTRRRITSAAKETEKAASSTEETKHSVIKKAKSLPGKKAKTAKVSQINKPTELKTEETVKEIVISAVLEIAPPLGELFSTVMETQESLEEMVVKRNLITEKTSKKTLGSPMHEVAINPDNQDWEMTKSKRNKKTTPKVNVSITQLPVIHSPVANSDPIKPSYLKILKGEPSTISKVPLQGTENDKVPSYAQALAKSGMNQTLTPLPSKTAVEPSRFEISSSNDSGDTPGGDEARIISSLTSKDLSVTNNIALETYASTLEITELLEIEPSSSEIISSNDSGDAPEGGEAKIIISKDSFISDITPEVRKSTLKVRKSFKQEIIPATPSATLLPQYPGYLTPYFIQVQTLWLQGSDKLIYSLILTHPFGISSYYIDQKTYKQIHISNQEYKLLTMSSYSTSMKQVSWLPEYYMYKIYEFGPDGELLLEYNIQPQTATLIESSNYTESSNSEEPKQEASAASADNISTSQQSLNSGQDYALFNQDNNNNDNKEELPIEKQENLLDQVTNILNPVVKALLNWLENLSEELKEEALNLAWVQNIIQESTKSQILFKGGAAEEYFSQYKVNKEELTNAIADYNATKIDTSYIKSINTNILDVSFQDYAWTKTSNAYSLDF